MAAGTVHLSRLQHNLDADYAWLREGLVEQYPNLDEDAIRTRQLLGFALVKIAGCPKGDVFSHITDGINDRGIDAIYFNRDELNLYIFQSKYVKDPTKGPIKEADALKFADGIEELFELEIFKEGNDALNGLEDEISAVLERSDVVPIPILISTSDRDIAKTVMGRIDRRLKKILGEKNALKYYRLSDLYGMISTFGEASGIEIKLMLNDYRAISAPYIGYYGWVTGETLAQLYQKYGSRLFSKNLRSSLGRTPINEEMEKTATSTPEYFWYFNNGVTFVSSGVARSLLGGASADSVQLTIANGSIVNGAQTTTTLGNLLDNDGVVENLARIKCLVRIIEIPTNDHFVRDVTRYNNSQNDLGAKDFVSLDPFQQKLRRELDREYAINYVIRSGEGVLNSDPSAISLQEATLALVACGTSPENAVRAKGKISALWRDVDKAPYITIFDPNKVTALALRKAVYAHRLVEEFLSSKTGKDKKKSADSDVVRKSVIATHGNRSFAFYVLRGANIYMNEQTYDQFVASIDGLDLELYFEYFVNEVYNKFSGSYMAVLFKNAQKCATLLKSLPRVEFPSR